MSGSSSNRAPRESSNATTGMILGMLFGMALGIVFGAAADNMTLMTVGMGAGMCIGLAIGSAKDRRAAEGKAQAPATQNGEECGRDRRTE